MPQSTNNRKIRALVFDLDGTLVDSLDDIARSLNHALRSLSLASLDTGWVREHVGQGAAWLAACAARSCGSPDLQDLLLARFRDHYEAHPCETTAPYPGVEDFLAGLACRRLPLGVISNKPTSIVRKVLDILGFSRYFQQAWGADAFPEKKPSPLPLLHFLNSSGVPAGRLLMTGDSAVDMECARQAGTRSAFFTGGYGRLAEGAAVPEFCFGRWPELTVLLEDLLPPRRS